jgi:superoxide dismutase
MFEQVKLPYAFEDLEPHFDTLTMETHYLKHHASYTKNFNDLAKNAGIDDKPIEVIFAHWKRKGEGKPDAQGIRNNGGGYFNHNLFFGQLSNDPAHEPSGELANIIDNTFGSYDSLREELTKLATGQFGSGWAWLNTDIEGNLSVSSSPNQDNPILESEGKLYPILAIDVWEHAYYLKYKNLRADYVKDFFEVVDWNKIAKNYESAKEKLVELAK